MNLDRLSTPQKISAVSILVVALGAVLPWASVFGLTVNGLDGDGVITLLLAIAGGVILAVTTGLFGTETAPPKWSQITLIVLAALVALIAIIDLSGVAAIGLYLTLFAGIAWVVGAVWQLNLSKQPVATPPAQTTED
jgi:hypothetical protein